MSDTPTAGPADSPLWRGPAICVGVLALAFVLLAVTGASILLLTPLVVGAWSLVRVRGNSWYWIPLVPCVVAALFWLYVFVTFLIGFLLG